MLEGAKETLTKPVGPLPLWGWAAVGVGGFVAFRFLTGGGGAGSSPVTLGDAGAPLEDLTGGAGGSDGSGTVVVPPGIIQPPITVPGNAGGNGTTRMILTTKGSLPFQNVNNLDHVAGHVPATTKLYVERVTHNGKAYYRILGRVGPNGTLVHSNWNGKLIRDRAELRTLFTISHTPATQAA